MNSLGTVLGQEMIRFNKLLRQMGRTLRELKMAIAGETLMSSELDQVYVALVNNQVPEPWSGVAYPSLKPLASWVKDLYAKVGFMRRWLVGGPPTVFWLSGFFFPQGFMTGALQNHSRKYQIAIDTLNYAFDITHDMEDGDITEKPEDGVYVRGLFMQGAAWDGEAEVMVESRPGEIFTVMPIIHFVPAVKNANPFGPPLKPTPGIYSCPVYKTSVRAGQLSTTGMSTNFVVAVDFPTVCPDTWWTLKGVACLTQLDD